MFVGIVIILACWYQLPQGMRNYLKHVGLYVLDD